MPKITLTRWAQTFTHGRSYDPRLLTKALGEGRVRGIGVALLQSVFSAGDRAESVLRQGLRDARALHSRERRMVSDALRDIIKLSAVFDQLYQPAERRFHHYWFGWLALQGTPLPELQVAWTQLFAHDTTVFLTIDRCAAHLEAHLQGLNLTDRLRLLGAMSEPTARSLLHSYPTSALALLSASNQRAPVVLRVNTRRARVKTVLNTLLANGLDARLGRWSDRAIVLSGRPNLDQEAGYRQGLFEVQDEGSQLLAELLHGEGPVVDFCAGAGGKSLALADTLPPKTTLLALDVRPRALEELRRRAKRARCGAIQSATLKRDGPLPKAAQRLIGRCRSVLVDAPCSGTGVWRRHPEYRWRAENLSALTELQGQILTRATPLVGPGGELIYATCSLLHEENERLVQRFLSEQPDFSLVPIRKRLGEERAQSLGDGDFLRLNPHQHGTDGFFGAILQRRP